jgi:hypothetical protein
VTILDLVAIAVGVAVVAIAGALVPALLELRRAARSLDRLLATTQTEVPGLAERTAALLDESRRLVSEARASLARLERAAGALRVPVAGVAAGLREALLAVRKPR